MKNSNGGVALGRPRRMKSRGEKGLAEQYRPRTFSEVFGQEKTLDTIRNIWSNPKHEVAFLLSGRSGSGKTSIARIMALSANCEHGDFGEPCKNCLKKKYLLDLTEINASDDTGIDGIRTHLSGYNYFPMGLSKVRVYILDEAQRLSVSSQNFLLKPFEDGPESTLFFICTTEPSKIILPLRRRCVKFSLASFTLPEIEQFVKKVLTCEETTFDEKNIRLFVENLVAQELNTPGLVLPYLEKFIVANGDPDVVDEGEGQSFYGSSSSSAEALPGGGGFNSAHLMDGSRAETKLNFRTAKEYAHEAPAEVPWVVKPFIAAGCLTEIAGKAKASGKTTLLAHAIGAVLDGTPFMGEPTTKTPVVYLTEERPTSFQKALARAQLSGREDLFILPWHETAGTPWPAIVKAAIEECKRRDAKLLVVDTFSQFVGVAGHSENSSDDTLVAMKPLQEAAAAGLAVVVVRHERKSGGDVGDAGRGSSAFAGAVDIVISVRRPKGNHRPTVRELHCLARFSETPSGLMIELTPDGYVSLGSSTEANKCQAREEVLDSIPKGRLNAIPIEEIEAKTSKPRTQVQRFLNELQEEGLVHRSGKGKKGSPYRYFRPEKFHSAQITNV